MLEKYIRPLFEAPDMSQAQGEAAPAAVIDAIAVEAAAAAPDPAQEEAEAAPAAREPTREAGKPWFLKRISEESQKVADANSRLAAAERRAAEAEALAERLQSGDDQSRQPPKTPANANDFDARVRAEASRQRFLEDTVDVRNRGLEKFGTAFNDTLGILNAAGATSDDFVGDVLAVDKANAHALLTVIAEDPEKAVALAAMNSRQRIAELTRMSIASAAPRQESALAPKPEPRRVSAAPAPAPRIEPGATKVVHGYDDSISDEEFTANWRASLAKRTARR